LNLFNLKEKEACISLEFYENNSFDLEGDYIEQKNKPPTFFEYQGVKKEVANAKLTDKPRVFHVRVPIVNKSNEGQFPLKFFFYFKSNKPQEFWLKRGTRIYMNK
jgi:hypothetical protein